LTYFCRTLFSGVFLGKGGLKQYFVKTVPYNQKRGENTMSYICQNCGVVTDDSNNICNPINEEYKSKACSIPEIEVCKDKRPAMEYSCVCGNVSANPQSLCRPSRIL
jgi:hypothetical protein